MSKFNRSLLFNLDPETAHDLTLRLLKKSGRLPMRWILQILFAAPRKPVEAFGLTFPNPIGLAAGYDKDAVALRGLAALGFGHIEVGTVTPLAQEGNPKPRIFRLPEDGAIINRMGFPSNGANAVVRALEKYGSCRYAESKKKRRVITTRNIFRRKVSTTAVGKRTLIGVSLGKNKNTPNEEAVLDYLSLLELFAPCADYLTVNVSSPNTVGLRQLQARDALEDLLSELDYQRKLEQKELRKHLPLLVKLSPDLDDAELDAALDAILRTGMDGVIATNTTLARDEGLDSVHRAESGGLSGAPLRSRSEAALRQIVKIVDGKIPVVSVGGIMTPDDVKKRLDMGAALVQLYTGLIYAGPGLVRQTMKALARESSV